ncbi:MAG: phosphate transport system regulatory protein PhoU [Ignavibacteria bacterium]|nr:MAG: phosphate transport system regulatory protein PhoU [Ignavibacteria bacterium]
MTDRPAINSEQLKRRILSLSALVEENARRCVIAIRQRDREAAERVIASDKDVDRLEIAIEEDCVHLLMLGGLPKEEIRLIVAILKINSDLERIGDLSANIARRVLNIGEHDQLVLPNELMILAERTMTMVRLSLDSLVGMDAAGARDVCAADSEVDALHREMHDLVRNRIQENPEQTERLLNVLAISRHLERIADYATNIAENVVYVQEEKIIRHHHRAER